MIGEQDFDMAEQAIGRGNPRYAADSSLYVRFYTRMVEDHEASLKEGRRMSKSRDYVVIMTPGGKNNIVDRPVTDLDAQRFADIYGKFKRNEEHRLSGTPLIAWTGISEAQAKDLEMNNIFTVEQLAEMPDVGCQRIMGGNTLKGKAKKFIELSKSQAPIDQLQAEIDQRENENAVLRSQMEALQDTMRKMQAAAESQQAPTVSVPVDPTPEAVDMAAALDEVIDAPDPVIDADTTAPKRRRSKR